MGRTLIELDSERSYVYEPTYMRHVSSVDIGVNDSTSARLQKWSGTGTITLRPVNLSTDFHETADYENLKYRLTDVNYNKDWWKEVPLNTQEVTGECDFFFSAKVTNVNLPQISTDSDFTILKTLAALDNLAAQAQAQALALQSLNSVGVIVSNKDEDANQGYYLRFRIDDLPHMERAAILDFVFGDFWLRLNGDGTAELYQTLDYSTWQFWESFRWHDGPVHGYWHRIAIFPHARDRIEFLAQSPMASHELDPMVQRANAEGVSITSLPDVLTTSHIFKSRGPTLNPDGQTYTITRQGKWAVYAHRKFRPLIQVSKLGFYNGTDSPCYVYDGPNDIGFVPTIPINLGVNADVPPGCELDVSMQAPDPAPLASSHRFINGKDSAYIFSILMRGDSLIPGNFSKPVSKSTPELYDYSVDKAYGIDVDRGAAPQSFPVLHVSIDSGSSPETESLEVSIDNADGQVDDYVRRSHIPCKLWDENTGVILFEGSAHSVKNSKAPAKEPKTLHLQIKGMTYTLQKHYPTDLDFSMGINSNSSDASNTPWSWQAATYRSFETGGFPASKVIFEGTDPDQNGNFRVAARRYDFPLWAEGATGRGTDPTAATSRWRPNPTKPVVAFISFLLQDVLGWHWAWDRQDSAWHIFKRPSPEEAGNLPIVAAFFKDEASLADYAMGNSGIPCYLHSELEEEAIAPECTTIDAWGAFPHYVFPTRHDLEQQLKSPVQEGDAGQAVIRPDNGFIRYRFDNPAGYQKRGGPPVDRTSVDFLRTQIVREFNLTQAATKTAFMWIGRRVFEDNCYGKISNSFVADWGDTNTAYLRKWNAILIDGERFILDRIEPQWSKGQDGTRRARYSAWLWRPGVPVPR